VTDADVVSLREYAESLIAHERELREAKFHEYDKAIMVADKVLERTHRNTLWLAGVTITVLVDLLLRIIR